jgi:hypothetical protein
LKLIANTYPFRLEQGYELGVGPAGYEMMAQIISIFQEPHSDILFSYTNWDRDRDPHKDELMKEAAHDFHYGIINDPVTGSKVKEILLHHYAPERDPKASQSVMEKLLTYFREVPLEELNEELLRKIGAAVYEIQGIYTLEEQETATQEFVNSRLAATNSVWLLPYDRPVYLKNIMWYRVNTEAEMVQAFELTDWWFTCAIVDRNKSVEDYRYFLNYTEEQGEDHDGMVLYISTPDPQHFKDTIIPRLKELLGNQLEIVG